MCIRDRGQTIHVHPYVTGSGKEPYLEKGEVYLFLAGSNPRVDSKEQKLLRVESLEKESYILELIDEAIEREDRL